MQLQAKLTNRKDCYVSLPRNFQKYAHQSYSQGTLCSVIQVQHLRLDKIYYFGCQGGVSQDHTIEMNFQLAQNLGIEPDDYVIVQLNPNCEFADNITVYVQEWSDYLIVQHRREYFESALLNNIQILFKGLLFPIHYQDGQFINFHFRQEYQCIAIAPESQITILIEEDLRPKQKEQQLHLEVEIIRHQSFQSFVLVNTDLFHQYRLDKLHKISHITNFPSQTKKFDKFQKQQTQKEQKEQAIRNDFLVILPYQNVKLNKCQISELLAKNLRVKEGQLLNIDINEANLKDESQIRLVKRNQLINQNYQFQIYTQETLNNEYFINLIIGYLEKQKITQLISGIHYERYHPFYFRIIQKINNIDHPLISLAIEKDIHDELCKSEKELLYNYLNTNIKIFDLTNEIKKAVKFHRFQTLFKQPKIHDTSLFQALYSTQLNEIKKILQSNTPQIQIIAQPNVSIQTLNKILKQEYYLIKLQIDKITQNPQVSVDLVKQFINNVFQLAQQKDNSLIIISGIETIKNTELIDFQQSYQILFSNVLGKVIKKNCHFFPTTQLLIIVPMKDYLNAQLKQITQTIVFPKPKPEIRKHIFGTQFQSQIFRDKCEALAEDTENFNFTEFQALQKRENLSLSMKQDVNKEWIDEQISVLQTQQLSKTKKIPTFQEIGGLVKLKQSVLEIFDLPLKFGFIFEKIKIKLPKSVLLYGMPGCGKTYFGQAICNELKINVISVKGPELLDKYIGGSEQNVRNIFEQAQMQAPCIIFLDEIDSIVPVRTSSHSGVTDRVVNQFLCYLDGVEESSKEVYIVAASSRPDLVDPALLRPGRIDKHLRIDYPDEEEIEQIIDIYRGPLKFEGISKKEIIQRLLGLSQADIVSFFKETRISLCDKIIKLDSFKIEKQQQQQQIKQNIDLVLDKNTFIEITNKLRSSLSKEQQQFYNNIYNRFQNGGGIDIKNQKQALY